MNKNGLTSVAFTVFLLGFFLLSSCMPTSSLLGPTFHFQKMNEIPDNMGLVYLYRPCKLSGAIVFYDVMANKTIVTTLFNCGFYPYLTRPGKIKFWWADIGSSKSYVTLDVKAGQTYFIRGTLSISGIHLKVVPPEIGIVEIAECRLIPERKAYIY